MKKALVTGVLAACAVITSTAWAAESASAASIIPQSDSGSSHVTVKIGAPKHAVPRVLRGRHVHEFFLNGRTYVLPSCQYVVNGGVYVSPACPKGKRRPMYVRNGRWHALPGRWCDRAIAGLPGRWFGVADVKADPVVHKYVLDGRTYALPSCQYVVNGGVQITPTCGPDQSRPVYILNGRQYDLPGQWCDQAVGLPGRWYGLPGRAFGWDAPATVGAVVIDW